MRATVRHSVINWLQTMLPHGHTARAQAPQLSVRQCSRNLKLQNIHTNTHTHAHVYGN